MPKMPEVKDKSSQPIKEGDHVWTPFRGGHREGNVDRIVGSEEEAREAGVKHPPKVIRVEKPNSLSETKVDQVLFQDQHGHSVAHNPEALQHRDLAQK
jgi:hypothetical protein